MVGIEAIPLTVRNNPGIISLPLCHRDIVIPTLTELNILIVSNIFRDSPHLDLEGLFKRHFTMVTFLQGVFKILNLLWRKEKSMNNARFNILKTS